MTDKILLTGMEFFGHHGCSDEERQRGQVFKVDAELILDLSKSAKSDDIKDTVDYVSVFNEIKTVVTGKPRNLIETVAEDIAQTILEKFYQIETVKINLQKPSAGINGVFDAAAVSIIRHRN